MFDQLYQVSIVFIMAAVPWLEIWLAIPAGIAMGLNPVVCFTAAVTGNFLPLVGIKIILPRTREWFFNCFLKETPDGKTVSRRRQRFSNLWNKYGLPGVALSAPATLGAHLATILALLLGSPGTRVLSWMAVSLVIWGAGTTVVAYFGIEAFRTYF
jgi:uncharacterized membrane protein